MENGVRVAVMGSRDARRTERGSFFLPSRLLSRSLSRLLSSCVFLRPLPSLSTLLAPLFFALHSLSNSKLSQTKALQDGAASFFHPFLNFASFPRQMACDKTPASLRNFPPISWRGKCHMAFSARAAPRQPAAFPTGAGAARAPQLRKEICYKTNR